MLGKANTKFGSVGNDLSHLRVFVCRAFVYVPKKDRRKPGPKAVKCQFMSYANDQRVYKLYDPKLFPAAM